jgi:uncharacterized membrane protein YozB (DUF420 family)
MAEVAVASRVDVERRFFTSMVVAMAAFVFIGFAPSYFAQPLLGGLVRGREVPPITPMVHLHAVTGTAWMLFLIWQAYLIRERQHQRHMQNGLIGAGIAIAVVVVGFAVAIDAGEAGRHPPGWTSTAFLMMPLSTATLFGAYVAAALWRRRKPDYHKRLMLLATVSLLLPAGSRISTYFFKGILPPGPLGGLVLTDLFIAALVAYDLKKQGRLHPATLWGGGLMLLSQPARLWLSQTEAWNAFAARLIG